MREKENHSDCKPNEICSGNNRSQSKRKASSENKKQKKQKKSEIKPNTNNSVHVSLLECSLHVC